MNSDFREREKLLTEVLVNETDVRQATLQAGLSALRGRRVRRYTARVATFLIPSILAAGLIVSRMNRPFRNEPRPTRVQMEETVPGTRIHVLTDEQLLDMFQGRPVALVGPPGNQRLLLLDQAAN
jgi:hypothetical protein